MTLKTETQHAGGFIVSEANGTRARELITLVTGQNLLAGAVLGKITASGKYAVFAPAATDGTETAAAVLFADVDATIADQPAVALARDAELDRAALVYASGVTDPQKVTAETSLATHGLILR